MLRGVIKVSTLGMPRGVIKARASTSGETMSTIEILFQSRVREPITDHPTKICNQNLKSEHTGDFVLDTGDVCPREIEASKSPKSSRVRGNFFRLPAL
jgi:hypothetical protein